MKLQIKEKDGKLFTSSKEIANACGKRHDNVLRDIKDEFEGEIEDSSNLSSPIFESYYINNQNKKQPMYILDEYAALRLCARYKKEVRKNVIEAFKQAKEKLIAIEKDPLKIFENATPDQINYVAKTLGALAQEKEKNQQQAKTIQEQKPKVDYYDEVLQSPNLIRTSCLAKDFGVSAPTLNDVLLKLKVHYKLGKQWLLYAKYQDKGYVKSRTSKGGYLWTYWTQIGVQFVHEILKKHGLTNAKAIKKFLESEERENESFSK